MLLVIVAGPLLAQENLADRLDVLQRQGMDRFAALEAEGPMPLERWRDFAEADWPALLEFIEAAEAAPETLPDRDLRALYIAMVVASDVAATLPEDPMRATRVAAALERALMALDARGQAGPEEFAAAYAKAFALGRWPLVAQLRERVWDAGEAPVIEVPPEDAQGRHVWRVQPAARRIETVAAPDLANLDWVVVVSPSCGPSRRFLAEAASDEGLRALFGPHVVGLALPPQDAADFDRAFELVGLNARLAIHFLARLDDWPILAFPPAYPTFYRLRDGKLVGRVTGWGGAEGMDKLIDLDKRARTRASP